MNIQAQSPGQYVLIWTTDTGVKLSQPITSTTWIGRPGGFNIPVEDPYMVILVQGNKNHVKTGIHDPTVSRKHSVLEPTLEGIRVIDTGSSGKGSTNGTYINEERIPPGRQAIAQPGDTIRVGLYTVFKVGLKEKTRTIELARPGDLVTVDSKQIDKLPEDLLRTSIRLDKSRYLVYIPRNVEYTRTSFDSTSDIRVRIKPEETTELQYQKRILQNIIIYLKDVQLDLNKDPPRGQQAATKLYALLKVNEYRMILYEVLGRESIDDITTLCDLVLKGRAGESQIKRLIIEVDALARAIDLKIRALSG
ncbi:MAG: FHA domain-containing protein [Desulfurococcales archaeon]|nr:FHA domain-containing protein [Desulfurococcales archaeon]